MPDVDRDPFEHLKLYLEELQTRETRDNARLLERLNVFFGTRYKDLDSIPQNELLRMINNLLKKQQ